MELDKDFKEFVELLNANKVEYLIVGGYSVAFYGFPRYTGDFDVWINPTQHNSVKIMKVLEEFGFGAMGLTSEDFLQPDKVVQFGVEPLRIDVLTAVDGIPEFDAAYSKKVVSETEGVMINFIGYKDLILNKKASNRDRDLLDIKELKKVKSQEQNKDQGMSM